MNSSTPKWIIVYLWIVTVMALIFSIMGYIKPDVQFGTWQAFGQVGALSIIGPLGLYLARNIATVAVCAFALFTPSIAVLQAAFILRGVTDMMDLVHNAIGGNMPIAIFALVMFLIEVFALIKLRGIKS